MDNPSKNQKDNIRSIAFHESGHAYSRLLVRSSFDFVTIDPVLLKVYTSGQSSGYIFPLNNTCTDRKSLASGLLPDEFIECFKTDFTIVAGLVAETIYRKGKFNKNDSKSDVKMLHDNPLMNKTEPFRTKYRSFLLEYTFQLFKQKEHFVMIKKIAAELLDHKTLSYEQVRQIVESQAGR